MESRRFKRRYGLLVQSQNDPVRLAEDIEKSGRCLLLHLLRDTLLARRRDVRGLDVDRNAGLGSCVGGHVVVVVCDVVNFERWVIIFGRMKQQQVVIVRLGEARVHVFGFHKETWLRSGCDAMCCCVITPGHL